jgi:transcriptional regulator with XRE-family HTH domain
MFLPKRICGILPSATPFRIARSPVPATLAASGTLYVARTFGSSFVFTASSAPNILCRGIPLQDIFRDGILLAMARHKKTRGAASRAVIDLRNSLGKTQQEFAHALKCAISTVARWETKDPPKGDALFQLAEFAKKQGHTYLGQHFELMYLDEVRANLGPNAKLRGTGSPKSGLVIWNDCDNEAPNSADFFRNAARELLELADSIDLAKGEKK